MLPDFPPDMTAAAARLALHGAGWREIGVGDWSWVFADPADRLAARATPFDPAYRLHAEACRAGPPNRYLPRIDAIHPLMRDGHVVVMERLWPAEEHAAAALCAAVGIVNDTGYAPPPGTIPHPDDTDLADLRRRLRTLLAEGARRYRLWGGSDIRPGNMLADRNGGLKLVDPVFVKGKAIAEAIGAGDRASLADFTRAQLEDFLTIPPFRPGPETDTLRARLAGLYAAD
ncbi:MAG: hypothetical protein IT548_02560 [Alphaproteobacteria bacterium]|nr:hypothetical protein [Alphaproteobacteria bacterium]